MGCHAARAGLVLGCMSDSRVPEHRVVVVGAGYAGLLAAARLARQPGVGVTLIDPSPVFIERIRLHQWASGQRRRSRPLREMIAPGVRWLQTRAVGLELDQRRVRLADGVVEYDQLIVAVGSVVERARVPGVAAHCLSLQTAEDCAAIRELAGRGGSAVVVGFGMTGVEAACELAGAFPRLRVTLVGRGGLGDGLSPAGEAHLRGALARLGVAVREHAEVRAAHAGRLELADGELPFSLCVWAGGFVAPELAARAGLQVGAGGRAKVDASLRAIGHPEVLVIGDAAELSLADGGPLRMACATAMPMGAHAAEQALRRVRGEPPTPLRYGAVMLCVSLGRRDGLIQMLTPDDRPRPRIVGGRAAVFIKEAVCRMTTVALRAESRGIRLFRWLQPSPGAALPQATAGVHS